MPVRRMLNAILRGVGRGLVCILPKKASIARVGALLPPSVRSKGTVRFFTEVVKQCSDFPAEIESNLGIDNKLRVAVASIKTDLIFGAPHLILGERSTLDLAVFAVQNSDCFIDIGSNIGIFTYYLRSSGQRKPIYFIEADVALFAQAEKNFQKNKIENTKGFQVAIGATSGPCIFFRNRTDDQSGSIIQEDWAMHDLEAVEADQTSFDDFVTSRELDRICVKVDVEGAEDHFYEGAKSSLRKVNYLIIEILGPAINRGFQKRLILEDGFFAYYINDYNIEHSRAGEYNYVYPFYNWLFCRDNPESLREKLRGTRFRILD